MAIAEAQPPKPGAPSAESLVVDSLLRSATLAFERGDYEAAERSLRQGLARVPEHPGCLAELALTLAVGQRRFVTAERLAARAIRVAPQNASGYHALGRIYLLGARKQRAFRFLMKAHALSPEDHRVTAELRAMGRRRAPVIRSLPRSHPMNVLLGQARAFLSSGRRVALVATLILVTLFSLVTASYSQPASEETGRQITAGLARLDSLLASGRGGDAVREARALLELQPPRPDLDWQVKERLGIALHRLGRDEEAVASLESALGVAPQAASVHLNLATALMAVGQRGRAFGEFQEAVALDPGNWRARLDYGQVLGSYGQGEAARRQLTEAARLCGDCPESDRALAALDLAAGDFDVARPRLERSYAAEPTPDLRRALALARLRTGEAEAARALLLPAWPDDLNDEERRLILEADRALGDPVRAREIVHGLSAEGTPRGDPSLWGVVALICLESRLDAEGLRAIEVAIALDPRNAGYRNNRVILLERMGRRDEAACEWQRAVALDPSLAGKRN